MIKQKLRELGAAAVTWRPDALMVSGAAAISYGAWQVYGPAGYIVGGLFALAIGWLDSKTSRGAK